MKNPNACPRCEGAGCSERCGRCEQRSLHIVCRLCYGAGAILSGYDKLAPQDSNESLLGEAHERYLKDPHFHKIVDTTVAMVKMVWDKDAQEKVEAKSQALPEGSVPYPLVSMEALDFGTDAVALAIVVADKITHPPRPPCYGRSRP